MLDVCFRWGNRVIVLLAGRKDVTDDGHPGITKMKTIARQVVWWPGIDSDLTKKVQSCEVCLSESEKPS